MFERLTTFIRVFVLTRRSVFSRYAAAVILIAFSLSVTAIFQRHEGFVSLSVNLLCCMLAALYGGLGPALVASALSVLGVDYLFLEPIGKIDFGSADLVHMIVYTLNSFVVSVLVAVLRHAYAQATEAKKVAERAVASRESMLAFVSHDLRNPLTTISLSAQIAQRVPAGDHERLKRHLDRIGFAAEQMTALIQDLLDSHQITSGNFTIIPIPENLATIVKKNVDAFLTRAHQKHVTLDVPSLEIDAPVECDPLRISQVLSNFLSNALKFTGEDGVIEVSLLDEGDTFRVQVRDSGPGVAAENLNKVFERYWQAAETRQKGSGLGLYISQNIIQRHGGRIGVESTPGQGATFFFTLPKRSPDQSYRTRTTPSISETLGSRPYSGLDDEPGL
jgi:signal transduction histidine kinase